MLPLFSRYSRAPFFQRKFSPHFFDLAKSFGMWGKQINSSDQFIPALKEAFMQKGPAIIGVPVDYSENMKLTKHLGKVSAII